MSIMQKEKNKTNPHSRLASVSSELNTLFHHNISSVLDLTGVERCRVKVGDPLLFTVFKTRPSLISDAKRDAVDSETLAACFE